MTQPVHPHTNATTLPPRTAGVRVVWGLFGLVAIGIAGMTLWALSTPPIPAARQGGIPLPLP